jgi:hypothetical protein
MRRTTVLDFQCAPGEFMLRARVADALMRVSGHGQWQRLFGRRNDRSLARGERSRDAAPFAVANRDRPCATRPALLSHCGVMPQAGRCAPTLPLVGNESAARFGAAPLLLLLEAAVRLILRLERPRG